MAQEETSGEYLIYHFNNVGSTTAVTNADGTIKYQYQYSPYGELLEGSYGEVAFLYNGQYGVASDDNGLYYMRARYYNIDIRRFVNQDILTGNIERSSSLNRYSYVEGNPVNYLDPFGLEKWIYDELHQAVAEIKKIVSLENLVAVTSGAFGIDQTVYFVGGEICQWSLTAILSIGTFLADTFLTGFDIGVYVNEWFVAAWNGDYERMIEINFEIANTSWSYAVSAVLFAVDEKFKTGGKLSFVWAWLSTLVD